MSGEVKVRNVATGTDAARRIEEIMAEAGPREEAAAKALRFYAPSLSTEDAASIARGTNGLIDLIEVQDAVREYYEAMGPVEVVVVDDLSTLCQCAIHQVDLEPDWCGPTCPKCERERRDALGCRCGGTGGCPECIAVGGGLGIEAPKCDPDCSTLCPICHPDD